eukprot:334275-Prorocentrum_minimum.AAC.1
MERCLFGSPREDWELMKNLDWKTTAIFLFDRTNRKLHGVFVADEVGFNLVPSAFNGTTPSQ